MKKRMIIPATVATLASTISAMPLQTLALSDAVTGVDVLQGVLFACFDENGTAMSNVTIEVFDVTDAAKDANDNYNVSALTPIRTFTTTEEPTAFSLENGKYVARITPVDTHILARYDNECEKNGANEISFDVSGGLVQLNLGFINKETAVKDSLSLTLMCGEAGLADVAVTVMYEAFNGETQHVGDFTTDENGKISFTAVDDEMAVGGHYYCTLKNEIDGYYAEEDNVITMQAIEHENNKTWFFLKESSTVQYTFMFFDSVSWDMLADFEFELTDENGHVSTHKTNGNGSVQVELAKGKYKIAAKNKNFALDVSEIDIQHENSTSIFVSDNTPKGMATFYVTDDESNNISGLSYDLYDSNNNLLFEDMPIENGLGVVYDLLYGEYKAVIKDIPAQYTSDNGTKTVTFTVNADSVDVPVSLKFNTNLYGECSIELQVSDADKYGVYLMNETVSVLNESNEVLKTVEMDEDGFAVFEKLPEGTYHFELSDDSEYYIVEGQYVTVDSSNKVAWQEVQAKKLTTTLVIGTQAPNPVLVESLSISLYKNGSIYGTYQLKNGAVTIPELTTGDYEIRVNNGPSTYKLVSDNTFSVTTADRTINKTLVFETATAPMNISVTESDNGNSVAGVTINIANASGDIVESIVTDGSEFMTANLPLGTYTVSAVVPEGYLPIAEKSVSLTEVDTPVTVSLETAYRVAAIALNVTDAEGYAVTNAAIEIVNENGTVVATKTFTNGEYYALVEDLPFGKYTIRAASYDGSKYVKPADITIELTEQTIYDVNYMFEAIPVADVLGDVSITLKDENGANVALTGDVLIAIYDADGNMILVDYADVNGHISFAELTEGTYKAAIFYADAPWTATDKSDVEFTIVAGETTNVNMTLYKGMGSAVFNVTDSETGNAVANVTVELFQNGESIGQFVTDSNGQIKIDELAIGTYTYAIVDVPDGYEGASQNSFDVTVDEKTEINIILVAQTGQAVINIVDDKGALLYDTVAITLIAGDGTEYNYTTSSGSINTGWIKTGVYEVRVNNEIDGYHVVSAENITITADSTELYDIVFAKNMGNATVKVAVQNMENAGLANARVEVRNADDVLIGTYTTDNDGNISLQNLEIGHYSAKIVDGTLPEGYSSLTGTGFEITNGCDENVVVYVMRDVGKVGVSVVDGDGNVMTDMPVTLTDADGNPLATVNTNDAGLAVFENVPTGNYTASVGADAGTHDIEGDFEYRVTKDADMSGTIYVARHKGWLYAKCNVPVEGIAFDVYDGDNVIAQGVTDTMGEVIIENIPTGNYVVKFTNSPSQYEDLADMPITITKNEETLLNINLVEKASKMTVKYVYDLTGNPTAGVKFSVTTLTGVEIETYTTDASGMVEMTLPEGYYFIKTLEVPVGYEMPADQAFEIVQDVDSDMEIRLELATSLGEFALLVQDSADNTAIAGATVKLYTEGGNFYKELTTDARGQIYDAEIMSGAYYAVITKDGYAEKVLENIVVEEGMMFYETVLLDAATVEAGKLTVTVYDNGTGDALAGATVSLRAENGDLVESLTAGEDGTVVFDNVEYGNYKIEAEADGYVASGRISAIVGAEEQSAVIRLDACTTGSVAITVHNDSDVALADAKVTLVHEDGEHTYELTVNNLGKGELAVIEAGTYEVSVEVDGHEPYSKTVTIEANKENVLDIELIEFKLGNIAFTVTDENDTPLANVKITLSDNTVVYTNEDGLASINNKDVGDYSVEFTLDGYESKTVTFNVEKDTTTRLEVSLNKIITTGTLVVNVSDEDGNSLENATIMIGGKTYETDSDGFVSIPELEAGTYTVTISKNGYNSIAREIAITAKTTTTANVTLKKTVTTGTINVVVTDVNGNALGNATVEFDGKTYETDENGLLTFVDVEEDTYTITVSKDGYKNSVAEVTVEAGNTYTVNAKLEEVAKQGNLNVLVKDEDGNVIEGASVVVNGQTVLSDASGIAAFVDLDAGSYNIEIVKNGYEKFTASVEVVAGATKQANATLIKAVTTGSLLVTVTDNDGNALANATVEFDGQPYKTDENGQFMATEVEAGTYTVKVAMDGYIEETHTVTIVAKQETRLSVALDEVDTTGDLVVTVVDENDEMLANATIKIDGKTVTTGENGVATINDLEAGEYTIEISKNGYETKSGTITITAGVINRTTVELKKEVALGNVHVVVEDSDAIKLENAKISIYDMNDKLVAEGSTSENGDLTVSDLSAGKYKIHVEYVIDENSGLGYIGEFEVEKDETTELLVKLTGSSVPETTGDAFITVVDKDGTKLENVEVKLNNGSLVSGKTAEDGTVIFEDLAPGEYTITATLDGYHNYTGTLTVEVGEIAEATIELEPITTGSLTVYVKDAQGEALIDATVEIDGKTYVTNADGAVYVEEIEAGDYTVKASLNGYVSNSKTVSVVAMQNAECTVSLEKEVYTGSGKVVITNLDGEPIADATVKLGGITIQTDADGVALFENLDAGKYEVVVTKHGFKEQKAEITIVAKETAILEMSLLESDGSVRFTVKDEDGNLLKGATVTINGETYTTDENGKVTVGELMPKGYDWKVSLDGYYESTGYVDVKADELSDVVVVLDDIVTTGTLSVKVVDEDGRALVGANVKVGGTTAVTDENGVATIDELEAGEYDVEISKNGYVATSIKAEITAEQTTEKTVTLEKEITTGSIKVVVTDESGKALADADVTIGGKEYKTNADGIVVVTDLRAGYYDVVVFKSGYSSHAAIVILNAKEEALLNVVLRETPQVGNVSFVVHDDRGKAIPNATITIGGKSYTTDKNGNVGPIELPLGVQPIVVEADSYRTINEDIVVTAGENTIELTMAKQAGNLSLTVEGFYGGYVEDALVYIRGNGEEWNLKTDENGNIKIEYMPAGNYEFVITKDGYITVDGTFTIHDKQDTFVLTRMMERKTHMPVEFIVTDKQGNVLAKAEVDVEGIKGKTDENGKLMLNVPLDYNVDTIVDKEYSYTVTKDGYYEATGTFHLGPNAITRVPVSLEKIPDYSFLTFQIKDTGGNLMEGVTITVSDGTNVTNLTTDEDGYAELLNLLYGNYTIVVSKEGYKSINLTETLDSKDGKHIALRMELDVPPIEVGTAIITVTDKEGNPLGNTEVVVLSKNGDYRETFFTNAAGNITIDLDEGEFIVSAFKAGYVSETTEMTIALNEVTEVTLELEAIEVDEKAYLEVNVKNQNEKSIVNAKVVITNEAGVVVYEGTLNNTSHLYLDELLDGNYTIKVTKAGHKSYETVFGMTSGETTIVNAVLEEIVEEVKAGAFDILVTNENGTPLGMVIVTILNEDGTRFGSYSTLSNGKIYISAVPEGKYSMYASYNGIDSNSAYAEIVGDQITTVKIIVDASKPGKPDKPSDGGDNVQTGDNSNVLLYGLLAALSAIGAFFTRKNKKNKKEE